MKVSGECARASCWLSGCRLPPVAVHHGDGLRRIGAACQVVKLGRLPPVRWIGCRRRCRCLCCVAGLRAGGWLGRLLPRFETDKRGERGRTVTRCHALSRMSRVSRPITNHTRPYQTIPNQNKPNGTDGRTDGLRGRCEFAQVFTPSPRHRFSLSCLWLRVRAAGCCCARD